MTEPSSEYLKAIDEALVLNKTKNQLCADLIKHIKTPQNKFHPDHGKQVIAKTFLHGGYKLSGQIIDAARIGHIQIAIVGLRPMFEMMINSKYIYHHPKHIKDSRHMRRVAKDIIRIVNKKRPTNHSRIDGKNLKKRITELKMNVLYRTLYKELSEWSHLGIRVSYLSEQKKGEQYAINTMSMSLCLMHDVMDSICEGFGFGMDKNWSEGVVNFRDKYQKKIS